MRTRKQLQQMLASAQQAANSAQYLVQELTMQLNDMDVKPTKSNRNTLTETVSNKVLSKRKTVRVI